MRTIGIVGVGNVGAHVAYALMTQGLADRILLHDVDLKRLAGETQDLKDARSYLPHNVSIDACTLTQLKDADVIVISLGAITQDHNRLSELAANASAVAKIVPSLVDAGFTGIFLNITNPCDIITRYVQKLSGFPQHRVLGTGTGLDSARFQGALADRLGLSPQSIDAMMVGEHGDSQTAVFSHLTIAGLTVEQIGIDKHDQNALQQAVIDAGWEIFQGKNCTEFGIATTAARMIRAILNDEHLVMPVSAALNGAYGISEGYAGTPCILGKNGVEQVLAYPLDEQEHKRFSASCALMDTWYQKIEQSFTDCKD